VAEAPAYVPDGDPCPKPGHGGQPTRLTFIPGLRPVSQCPECIEDFFRWFGQAHGTKPPPEPLITPPPRPQGDLFG
jgi:hypothetical protein